MRQSSQSDVTPDAGANGPTGRRENRPLGRLLAVGAAVAFIALLAFGLIAKAPNDDIDQALADGRSAAAPPFELEILSEGELPGRMRSDLASAFADDRLAIRELRGSPVVLNFWASWCTPCREEADRLERGWGESGDDGTVFLGLNMQDATDDAMAFIDEFGNTYPNVRDPTDSVANDWGVAGIPETFFISAEGRVVGHVIGVVTPEQLRAGIEAAQTGRVAAAARGGAQGARR